MKQRNKDIIRIFFSDYFSWILIVFVLFVVTLAAVICSGNANGFIWIVPASFVIIFSFSFRLLVLYCKAKKDLKDNNVETLTVRITKIQQDNTLGFKNRGGATVGKRKYKLIDENDNYYLLSTASDKEMFYAFYPNPPAFSIEIVFLKRSRLVLRMKIIDASKANKEAGEQKNKITQFKKVFSHYF
jgi:hypothetical protein